MLLSGNECAQASPAAQASTEITIASRDNFDVIVMVLIATDL